MRVPLTTPCPVKVNPQGEVLGLDGDLLPDAERTEYCAVDAQWMIGLQRVCDVHLRVTVDELDAINGTFEDIVRDAYLGYGETACTLAIAKAFQPWSARRRYSQHDARQWAEKER